MPPYGEFTLSPEILKKEQLISDAEIIETIESFDKAPLKASIITELIENGFIVRRRDIGVGYYQMTERGRELKEFSFISKYQEALDRASRKLSWNRRYVRAVEIANLLMCLWTAIAAAYYLHELLKK